MITNPLGGYGFLPGSSYLSFAIVAQPGYAIERAVFQTPRPLDAGLHEVVEYLAAKGRPAQALCGMEFRQYLPRQWPRKSFDEFNAQHVRRLTEAGMLVEGKVPVARTNVVLNSGQSQAEGGLHAFSYTVPITRPTKHPDFVLAAIPEVRFRANVEEVIAEGEASPQALRLKIDYILNTASQRMASLGLSWDNATGIQLYSEADLKPIFKDVLLDTLKAGGWRGIQWHHALPPIGPSIIELDARSVRADITLD